MVHSNKLQLSRPPITPVPQSTQAKKKILVWSDCVLATTGFGIVSKHILNALYNTGKYEIDQLAINYFGDFYDKTRVPYCLVPAKLNDPQDPYGNKMFVDALRKKSYDFVFIINDTFVANNIAEPFKQIQEKRRVAGQTVPKLVYYYPIDCTLLPSAAEIVRIADRSVAYTNFAKAESCKIEGVEPTDVIYHGTNVDSYYPLSEQEKKTYRSAYFKVEDDCFIIINVNRNSKRKDLAKSIYAFAEFKKKVPNSKLYLHALVMDGTTQTELIDLSVPIQQLGLTIGQDVLFPKNYSAAKGFPEGVLNRLYNCADMYLTTNLGEGWGLSQCEAMAAGTPVVVPNHTVAPEIMGRDRGYVFQCNDLVYVDNSGYRPVGYTRDIVAKMMECYKDWKDDKTDKNQKRKTVIRKARNFTERYCWENVCQRWVQLFSEMETALAPQRHAAVGEVL